MIAIVDYGLGNLASIKNMFKHIGVKNVIVTSDSREIANASKIILPGVGAFDTGMSNLLNLNLIDILNQKALIEKVPFLGICLGMQLMTSGSEEGLLEGLGWFNAKAVKFIPEPGLKVPHMGWNYVNPIGKNDIFLTANKKYRFYFVHSYYVQCEEAEDVLYVANYGQNFHAAICKENIYGMQFHPEKSLHYGMDILMKFSEI